MDVLLVAFVEFDGGERMIAFSGPTAVARLSRASSLLSQAICGETIREVCLMLPLPDPHDAAPALARALAPGFILSPEALVAAAGVAVDRGLLPEPRFLGALCRLCNIIPPQAFRADCGGLDEIFSLLAHGTDPGPAASMWARALRRPGVATLLDERGPPFMDECSETPHVMVTASDAAKSQASCVANDALFDAIFAGSVCQVVQALAAGARLDASGESMLNGDAGCCRWSPLAFAGHRSRFRRDGAEIVALLLAALADADVPCQGPCGWTPLMRTAMGGEGAAPACRLLVLARADMRRREAVSGKTALELGDRHTARAIREARDERVAMLQALESTEAKLSCNARAGGTQRGNRAVPPHKAAALASALASMSKGHRRGRGSGYRRET